MASRREQILGALVDLIGSDPFFPPCEVDSAEPRNWRASGVGLPVGLQDAVVVQDGQVEVTRDGGAEDDFELRLGAVVAYAVTSAETSRAARRARRDEAVAKIEALIAGDRSLGFNEVYAVIDEPAQREDDVFTGGKQAAVIAITINVDYTAASAAG